MLLSTRNIFKATNANPQPALLELPTFGGTQSYLQSAIKVYILQSRMVTFSGAVG